MRMVIVANTEEWVGQLTANHPNGKVTAYGPAWLFRRVVVLSTD